MRVSQYNGPSVPKGKAESGEHPLFCRQLRFVNLSLFLIGVIVSFGLNFQAAISSMLLEILTNLIITIHHDISGYLPRAFLFLVMFLVITAYQESFFTA
jgi:hypothetical protein